MLGRITNYLLERRLHAMLAAFVLAFVPLIGSISILIAALITLRKGILEGGIVLIAATLPVLIEYFTHSIEIQSGYPLSMTELLMSVVLINVLTWVFASVLQKYSSWSWVIQLAGLLAILTVILLHIIYPDIQAWWQTWLTHYFSNVQEKIVFELVSTLKPFATGLLTVTFVFYALLQLLIARWWQAATVNPGGLRKELYHIRMSYAAGIAFVIGLVFSLLGNSISMDVMPILNVMFVLAGLSLLQDLTKDSKLKWLVLVMTYGLIIVAPRSALLLAMVALLDVFIDFRNKFKKSV
jgi:hypothetical protein